VQTLLAALHPCRAVADTRARGARAELCQARFAGRANVGGWMPKIQCFCEWSCPWHALCFYSHRGRNEPQAANHSIHPGGAMLHWAAVFFVIALIAALFGFGGIAAGAASIAKVLFVLFIVLAIVALVMGRRAPI
jgi:uncharacterized membrane protein YtjA (UPF0391 family)